MPTLRIITFESPGLINDGQTYKNIFENNGYTVYFYTLTKYNEKGDIKQKYSDINLFLEHIYFDNFIDIFPSKLNLFMPNHELFISYKKLDNIDYILCKTKVALKMFKSIKKNMNHKYICFYTKFTTNISDRLRGKNFKKNNNIITHLAGKSSLKNTFILIYCWIKNNGFLDIDPDIELHVSCYRSCYNKMKINLKEYFNYDFKFKINNNIIRHKNIYLYVEPIPEKIYDYLIKRTNMAICISSGEGYGHYINEARYFETYILSVNSEPMNELVKENKNGTLIKDLDKYKDKKTEAYTDFELYRVFPTIDGLRDKIIESIKNKNNLHIYGKKGRNMYNKDKKYFINKMNTIIQINIEKKL